ncbi:MAG: ECF transporter S component [Clostridia bacterium]|nr:ECF transporter S component [Clostridia bacterium]
MQTKKLCIMGLIVALTCVATMCIHIPIPATNGYINVGDSIILISAVLLGGAFGAPYIAVAGGLGSALADLLLGYTNYVPVTFLVKGLEGLFVTLIALKGGKFFSFRNIAAAVLGVLWMVLGYFICESIMYGIAAAAGSVISNIIQAVGSLVIFSVLGFALYKANIQKYIE